MDTKLSSLDFEIGLLFSSDYRANLTISEIARSLGINHRTARLHVDSLARLGVFETSTRGRQVLVSPRVTEKFKKFMVMAETYRFFADKRGELVEISKNAKGRFCIVFGSFSRFAERPSSDIDILCNRKFEASALIHEPQFFVYRSIRSVPEALFREVARSHIIVRGAEIFVDEMVRRHEP